MLNTSTVKYPLPRNSRILFWNDLLWIVWPGFEASRLASTKTVLRQQNLPFQGFFLQLSRFPGTCPLVPSLAASLALCSPERRANLRRIWNCCQAYVSNSECAKPSHSQSLANFVANVRVQGISAARTKFCHFIRKTILIRS